MKRRDGSLVIVSGLLRGAGWACIVGGIACLAGSVAASDAGDTPKAVMLGLLGLATVAFGWKASRVSVVCSRDSIIYRSFRTIKIPVADIAELKVQPLEGMGAYGRAQVSVVLRDGTQVGLEPTLVVRSAPDHTLVKARIKAMSQILEIGGSGSPETGTAAADSTVDGSARDHLVKAAATSNRPAIAAILVGLIALVWGVALANAFGVTLGAVGLACGVIAATSRQRPKT